MAKAKKKQQLTSADMDSLYADIAENTNGEVLDDIDSVTYYIDTGSLALNYSCSGRFMGGGIPGGRLTEMYGPSSSSKSLIGSNLLFATQRMGGVAALLDVENAVNKDFMRTASHLNLKQVLRYTPPSLEKCFHKMYAIIEAVRKRNKDVPIVIVYDSLTSSPCERELREIQLPENYTEAEFKRIVKAHRQPGEHAKACSQELKKLNTVMQENNATVVILNQTRDKIGVMYGCFHYDSRVTLADGTSKRIGQIVNEKLPVEVLSYNTETKMIEPKKVVAWHNNGPLSDAEVFLQFTARKPWGNGVIQFSCTPNHQLFVWEDEKAVEKSASHVLPGDKLVRVQSQYLTEDQRQVVYGSVLGDGSLCKIGKMEDGCYQLCIDHGIVQAEYCRWKEAILSPWVGYSFSEEDRVGFNTIPMCELKFNFGESDSCVIPQKLIDSLDVLGLAVWYMDGGSYEKWGGGKSTLYCSKFNNREAMLPLFSEKFGLNPSLKKSGFYFNSQDTHRLHKLIAPYVFPAIEHKIHPKLRGMFSYEIDQIDESSISYGVAASEVLDVYVKPPSRMKTKYDITVEGNHTYVVDGAVVHNSPEQSGAGGNSLPFYASLRLRPQTQKKIEYTLVGKKKKCVGVNVKYRNVKNRSYRPFVEVEGVQLTFEKGINPISGLMLALLDAGRIQVDGKYYRVKDAWSGGQDVKFQTSLEANEVPLEVLLKCPKLVDAESKEQLEEYLAPFMAAVTFLKEDGVTETKVSNEDVDMEEELEADIEKELEEN